MIDRREKMLCSCPSAHGNKHARHSELDVFFMLKDWKISHKLKNLVEAALLWICPWRPIPLNAAGLQHLPAGVLSTPALLLCWAEKTVTSQSNTLKQGRHATGDGDVWN